MSASRATWRGGLIEELRQRIEALEAGARFRSREVCSAGCAAIDRLLPVGGLRRGTLVEWLAEGTGSGAATLALLAAREACAEGGTLVILDETRDRYLPAVAGWGIDLERVIVVRPGSRKDAHWAVDQALRCPAVAAVWGYVERLDGRTFRRWQLAAEGSGCLGLLMRPASVCGQPTWADVRLSIESRPSSCGRRLRVEAVRCRGGAGGGEVVIELDETTGILREVVANDETISVHRVVERVGA